MFKRLRIAVLLYVLLFVAAAQYLAGVRSTDWDDTLWVTVHPIAASPSAAVAARIDALDRGDFDAIERFFAAEAARYGVTLEQPFRFEVSRAAPVDLPPMPTSDSPFAALAFSLRLRWAAWRAESRSDQPSADITLFAVFHEGSDTALDRSVGLRKGLVAVANVFSDRAASGQNQIVMAHELLHTLGASDKYDPATNLPLFPDGYADPAASPRWPQRRAELMGGRAAAAPDRAEMPRSLDGVVIGPATAREIGWVR